MNHLPSSGRYGEAELIFCYIVLLLILMIGLEFARPRTQASLDLNDLLDKLENVGAEGRPVSRKLTGAPSWKARETAEMLRRMAGNALIFDDLVKVPVLEASSLDHSFIREIREQSIRLRFCVHLLRLVQRLPLHFLNAPGAYLLNYVVTTYWSIVYNIESSYRSHESPRHCAALRTACNLAA